MTRNRFVLYTFVLSAFLVTGWAGQAQAQLITCNQTDFSLKAAVAVQAKDGQFVTHGWIKVKPRSCATLVEEELRVQDYFVRIKSPKGGFTLPNADDSARTFCVREGSFKGLKRGTATPTCAPGATLARFFRVDAPRTGTHHTFTLFLPDQKPRRVSDVLDFSYEQPNTCQDSPETAELARARCLDMVWHYRKGNYRVDETTVRFSIKKLTLIQRSTQNGKTSTSYCQVKGKVTCYLTVR